MQGSRRGTFTKLAMVAGVTALGALAAAAGVDCVSSTSAGPPERDGAAPSNDSALPAYDGGGLLTPEGGADATLDAATPADSGAPVDSANVPPDAGADADAGTDSGPAADAGPCNGVCVVLASGQANVIGLATDGTNVYWTTDNGTGTVAGTPVSGAGSIFTLASGQVDPGAIATDGTNVYWVTYDNGLGGGTVMMAKAASDGGLPVTLAANQTAPEYLAVCPPTVFWTNEHDVYTVNSDGGDPETVPAGGAYNVACNASAVYWSNGSDELLAAPTPIVNPSAYSVLEPGQSASAIVADATNLYWGATGPDGGIWKASLDGGPPVNLCGAAGPETMAVDDQSVYWTTPTAGTVWKVPLGGGAPVLLAWDQDQPWTVAVDSTSVYWTVLGSGTVMKLTPK
jgi:hypothetical protein